MAPRQCIALRKGNCGWRIVMQGSVLGWAWPLVMITATPGVFSIISKTRPANLEKRFGHIRYTDEDRKQEWRPAEGIVGYPCFARLSDSSVYVVFHSQMMHKRLPAGEQVYIVGNLLRIPK